MSRIKKGDTSLRIELNNTDKYKDWSESPYEVISCISDDGINIIISSNIDPNPIDIILPYALIIEPVTANITELRDLLRCWILTKSRSAGNNISENGDPYIMVFPDVDQLGTPGCYTVIPNASCPYVLQNSGGTLYFDGLPLGGGGGGITTADNGLTINPAGNVQLGGSLINFLNVIDINAQVLTLNGTNGGQDVLFQLYPTIGQFTLASVSSGYQIVGDSLNGITTDSIGILSNTDSFLVRSQTLPSQISMTQGMGAFAVDHNNNITYKVTDGVNPLLNASCTLNNNLTHIAITLTSNTNTNSSSIILDDKTTYIFSGQIVKYRSLSVTQNILLEDYVIKVSNLTAACVLTLPVSPVGTTFRIKVDGSLTLLNTLTILPDAGSSIEGAASLVFTTTYESHDFIFTQGAEWMLL